ncbi:MULTISPECIES: DEAD/DEAH box helicase, partial [Haloferax]
MSNGSIVIDGGAIEDVWAELNDEDNKALLKKLKATTLRRIDETCKRQINAGEYDATAKLVDIYQWFEDKHLSEDSELTREVFMADDVLQWVSHHGRDQVGRVVFRRIIETLEQNDELLYVYDRQRVRSRTAEMARYFALIRQRISDDEETDFDFAPNLVKMVKMAIIDREQPIFEGEQAAQFNPTLRNIIKNIRGDVSPSAELQQTVGNDWKSTVKESVQFFKQFLQDGLHEDFDTLAAYQSRALVDLYTHAVTDQSLDKELAHVITASTGGGKTEAFLFPVLMYCHTAWKAGIRGNKAILTYPRRDLCDNQFERLFKYAHTINDQLGMADASFESAPVSISIQHGGRKGISLECPECDGELTPPEKNDGHEDGPLSCSQDESHHYDWTSTKRSAAADIIVTTQNSLHLRLMDRYGNSAFWSHDNPTKFLVLDEVHVYTEQAGMHISNVVRRFKRAVKERAPQQSLSLVASSATINNAEDFTERIFDTDEAKRIRPANDETDMVGSEYMLFVKATEPRDVAIPVGEDVFRPQDKWENIHRTTASNLSCMIQIGFSFWHTARKERGNAASGKSDKDKILGFVDSIDSVSRLGTSIEDAEQNRELFKLRRPDAFLRGENTNPDCPSERFSGKVDDQFEENAVCEALPPNKYLNGCPTYEAGECWWTMRENFELRPMQMAVHKSGRRQRPTDPKNPGDEWDQMIATSALEVGFDHPSIIGTFQYRAPMSVPGFLQRKGRGGRDADDKPVTVVVLGSTSTDSYYFHHSDYLSDPQETHLEIPLDEHNRFVRAEHMIAAVFDYFNIHTGIDANRIYQGRIGEYGPDAEELVKVLENRRGDLKNWLLTSFDASEKEVTRALDALEEYAESLINPVAPGIDETPFWKLFRDVVTDLKKTGRYDQKSLDTLISQIHER